MKRDGFWLGLGSLGLYSLFLTQQYAGDGLRWVSAITGEWPPSLGTNSHLLFPLLGWGWYHSIGQWLPAEWKLESIALMNGVAGAIGIMLFVQILTRLGVRRWTLWLVTLCLMFANAYWKTATDLVEVLPSVPLIFLSIWLALSATRPGILDWLRCLLAGAAMALATALYQVSAFSLLAVCAALWWQAVDRADTRRRVVRIVLTLGAFGIAVAAIYMIVQQWLGNAASWEDAFRLSLVTDSTPGFGGFDPLHLGGSLFGWVAVWLGLFDFQGVSYLLRDGLTVTTLANLALVTIQYGVWIIVIWTAYKRRDRISPEQTAGLKITVAWFLPPFLFTAYWLPAYGKLWLSPLAATLVAFAILLTAICNDDPSGDHVTQTVASAFCILTVTINLVFGLIPSRFVPNVYRQEVVALARQVEMRDLVITDGWGPSAVYYEAFTNKPALGYAGLAIENPRNIHQVAGRIAHCVAVTQSRGGTVYFLGLLDLSPADWLPLFDERLGMPYEQLNLYRAASIPLTTLSEETLSGRSLHFWQLSKMSGLGARADDGTVRCTSRRD